MTNRKSHNAISIDTKMTMDDIELLQQLKVEFSGHCVNVVFTRSQAIARIANCTAKNCRGPVT